MYPELGGSGLLGLVRRFFGTNTDPLNKPPRGVLIVLLAIASWLVVFGVVAFLIMLLGNRP